MVREIKLRAWDNFHKMYVPFNNILNLYISTEATPEGFKLKTHFLLEMATGLKDAKGKEIYEGDILRIVEDDEDVKIGSVYWGAEMGYPAFSVDAMEDCEYNSLQHATIMCVSEIIGNIHQNPELLKAS